MLRHALLALTLGLSLGLGGCSDDDASTSPAPATDGGVDTATPLPDSSTDDTGSATDTATAEDVADSTVDTSTETDTGAAADTMVDSEITWDTAGACHAFGFGAPAATIAKVSSLPTMTGGTIANGIYDAVAVQTTGSITGTYRATWAFVADMKIEAVEQLALSSSPPPPVPRVLSWSTSGTTLNRTQTCGGTSSFSNEYTVRTESSATFLDIRQDTVMFTFRKR